MNEQIYEADKVMRQEASGVVRNGGQAGWLARGK